MRNLIAMINERELEGSAPHLRNVARQLGGRQNWQKLLVTTYFGDEVCDQALSLTPTALEETKRALVTFFETQFTDEDRNMEIALQRAADKRAQTGQTDTQTKIFDKIDIRRAKKFDLRVRVGTKILIEDYGWYTVRAIHPTRQWVKVDGLEGEFTRLDVLRFSNERTPRSGKAIKLSI